MYQQKANSANHFGKVDAAEEKVKPIIRALVIHRF